MTEKRFTGEFDRQYSGVHDNGEQLTNFEVVDLLNDLSEENEQLKSKNRGLQSELQIFKEDITHSNLQINKLADENEMIRNTINEMYKNERTQLGKSVLKQLIEAIQ